MFQECPDKESEIQQQNFLILTWCWFLREIEKVSKREENKKLKNYLFWIFNESNFKNRWIN